MRNLRRHRNFPLVAFGLIVAGAAALAGLTFVR
jgi:hypothetical protein